MALGSHHETHDAYNRQSQCQGEPSGPEVVKHDFGVELKGDGDCIGLSDIQGCFQEPLIDRRKWRTRDEPFGIANSLAGFQGDRSWNNHGFEQSGQEPEAIDLCQCDQRTCIDYADPTRHHRLLAASSAANSSSV